MAKKRVFLDEQLGLELAKAFGAKAHIYTAADLGVVGVDDPRVIDRAVHSKCLIVTANKDFVDYYRKHPLRKGSKLCYFYGLIFLKPSKILSRIQQLKRAVKEIAWTATREHDDLVTVFADGSTAHERLCHPECAAELAKEEQNA